MNNRSNFFSPKTTVRSLGLFTSSPILARLLLHPAEVKQRRLNRDWTVGALTLQLHLPRPPCHLPSSRAQARESTGRRLEGRKEGELGCLPSHSGQAAALNSQHLLCGSGSAWVSQACTQPQPADPSPFYSPHQGQARLHLWPLLAVFITCVTSSVHSIASIMRTLPFLSVPWLIQRANWPYPICLKRKE